MEVTSIGRDGNGSSSVGVRAVNGFGAVEFDGEAEQTLGGTG